MTKENETLILVNERLNKTFAGTEKTKLKFLDKNLKPTTYLQVTSPELERDIVRCIAYVDGKYRQAYFVNYDANERIAPDEIRRKVALGQMEVIPNANGFTTDKKGKQYDTNGYLLVEQKSIIKIGEQFYYTNPAEKKSIPKKVEVDQQTGLISVGGKLYEQKGNYYYEFWDNSKVYTLEGQPLHSMQNPFLGERFPIKNWKFYNDSVNIPFPSDLLMDTAQSDRAFYLETKQNVSENVKEFSYTLTSYDPVTREPLDVVQVKLNRVEDGKKPATFRSDALVFNAMKATTENRIVGDQIKAFPGSRLEVSYPRIDGQLGREFLGEVTTRAVMEVNVIVYKDGHEKKNLEALKGQLTALKENAAVAGIQVKVVTKLVDIPSEIEFGGAEKFALHARQQASNPKGILMIVGAGNYEKVFTTNSGDFPKKAGDGFFVSDFSYDNVTSGVTLHLLEVVSGNKRPGDLIEVGAPTSGYANLQVVHHPLLQMPRVDAIKVNTPILTH